MIWPGTPGPVQEVGRGETRDRTENLRGLTKVGSAIPCPATFSPLPPPRAGPIPESVGTIDRLVRFKMQGNHLTGPIPANFGDLKALEWIRVFGAGLLGRARRPAAAPFVALCVGVRGRGGGLQWDPAGGEGVEPLGSRQNAESLYAGRRPTASSHTRSHPPSPDNQLSGTFGETFKNVNPRLTQLSIGGNNFEGEVQGE